MNDSRRLNVANTLALARGEAVDEELQEITEVDEWAALGSAIDVVDTLIGNGDLGRCQRAEGWLQTASGLPAGQVKASLKRCRLSVGGTVANLRCFEKKGWHMGWFCNLAATIS